ncbi:MAG: hypothetical protein LQ350_004195 [Teloschistes chrysophthalmus]|nr:MAG: hypothetical protein LQ350_004195 [Niorma chrysophthalma]
MSWVAKRETSRSEDMAYCLLGLFDINIPLLYGEGGRKAFVRLQTEIINKQEDESILAWEHLYSAHTPYGILAPHPRYFTRSGHIVPVSNRSEPRYWITNRGLALRVPAHEFNFLEGTRNMASIPLYCKNLSPRSENTPDLRRSSLFSEESHDLIHFPRPAQTPISTPKIEIMVLGNTWYRVREWFGRSQNPHEIDRTGQDQEDNKIIYFSLDSIDILPNEDGNYLQPSRRVEPPTLRRIEPSTLETIGETWT